MAAAFKKVETQNESKKNGGTWMASFLTKILNYVAPPSQVYDPLKAAEEDPPPPPPPTRTPVNVRLEYYDEQDEEEDEEEEDEDEEDEMYEGEQEELVYASIDDANNALLQSYWKFMCAHYGRTPAYRTDLYCSMLCIDVPVVGSGLVRFWWLSENHPLAVVLSEYYKENGMYPAYDIVSSPGFGLFYVYEDKSMDFCVDRLMEMYKEQGYPIEHTLSQFAQHVRDSIGPQCVIQVEEEQEEAVVIAGKGKEEQDDEEMGMRNEQVAAIMRPLTDMEVTHATIKPTITTIINRPENSKKAD